MNNLNNSVEKREKLSASKQVLLSLKEAKAKLQALNYAKTEPIAIVGMACRFPGGAENPQKFWQLLINGVDGIREIPQDRWDVDAYYDPNPENPGKMYTRWGGFLPEIDLFDPQFFGISPWEAISIDPQHRLLLEVSWEALENAGQVPERLQGSLTGVFVGITTSEYGFITRQAKSDSNLAAYGVTGVPLNAAAGRLSYTFGLTGLSMAIDTACSSSLVTIHQACQSLRQQECNMALAGGVNLWLLPDALVSLCEAKMSSPDGRCKTFDAAANGTSWGEGCGMLVLKRLSDAQASRDNILAVIRGSAVNQDGPSSGFTVPNSSSQQQVIHQALKMATVEPSQVSYLEAHGTATSLGDPIELRTLATVFGQDGTRKQPLIIGSVKTNIGHLSSAAGVSGVIKVILQLQHRQIAPHLHFKNPTPQFNWQEFPVMVPNKPTPWEITAGKRIAGISGFGGSGTNAHIVLEEAPVRVKSEESQERPVQILTLSAKTKAALDELVIRYQNHLETHPELELVDICYTANTGRAHFQHRLAIVASNQQELSEKLFQHQAGIEVTGVFSGQLVHNNSSLKVAFLFTGQGSQYVNMGKQLYQIQPVFQQAIDKCDSILHSELEHPLLSILYPETTDGANSSLLDQTAYTQPALFAIEYAIAQLWQSWGIKPDIVMGHSVGEYVAATVAGVLSLEDGLKLIAARGRLMQKLPSCGEMVSLILSEAKVRSAIAPYKDKVELAAINGPESIVISGESEAIGEICSTLESQGIKTKRLRVSHAFHSPMMEPMLADFEAVANQLTYHKPKIPVISNITGTRADDSIATANYWVNHVRQPVKFAQGMQSLYKNGLEVFLEIGAKPILLGMGRQCLLEETGIWLPSLRPGVNEWEQMLSSLGQLYVKGFKVDWSGFERYSESQKVVLPTYPFQRQKYWLEVPKRTAVILQSDSANSLLGQRLPLPFTEQIRFQTRFTPDFPSYLKDHQFYGKIVVPGASHIVMALLAGYEVFNSNSCIIENIEFLEILGIDEESNRTIQLILEPQKEGEYSCKLISCLAGTETESATSWKLHATAKIRRLNSDELTTQRPVIDMEAVCQRATLVMSGSEYYSRGSLLDDMEAGKTFQRADTFWLGEDEALQKLKLFQNQEKMQEYWPHPGMVDAGASGVSFISLANHEEVEPVPYAWASTDCLKFFELIPTNEELYYYTKVNKSSSVVEGQLSGDSYLLDSNGKVLAEFTGIQLRKLSRKVLLKSFGLDLSQWYYQLQWQTTVLPSLPPASEKENWIIFAKEKGLGDRLSSELVSQKYQCIVVYPADNYQQLDEFHYQLSPTQPDQFQKLLQAIANSGNHFPLKGIVHLWGIEENQDSPSIKELETAQELGCATVLHLVQALVKNQKYFTPLWLVTQGTQSVSSEAEIVKVQQGALWGLGRAIASEHPELKCRLVDLDSSSNFDQAIQTLIPELLSPNDENQIAYRENVRYVARLNRRQQDKQKKKNTQVSIPSEASYAISGGLGALGLEVAQWLVEQGARHLVLIGRRAPSETATETIKQLEQTGAQICILLGDISSEQDVAQILEQIQANLPPLKGVIHAAGVVDDGLLQQMSWERFSKVMASKVEGTWNLHQLTQNLPLDFFICFSSVASLFGSPGQGNYAAANAFMDAIAHHRRCLGLPGLSINWGPWAKIGMAARLAREHQNRTQASGLDAIDSEQGMQVLGELLSEPVSQVGVFPINWPQFMKQLPVGVKIPFFEAFTSGEPSLNQKFAFLEQLKGTPVAERQELLVAHLRRQVAHVLGISDSESIGLEEQFFDLGMDSLSAVDFRNRLQTQLQVSIPMQKWMKGLSIAELSAEITQQINQSSQVKALRIEYSNLVPIQNNGSKTPFFCIAGGVGFVSTFSFLANYLDSEQPLYGLQSHGLDGKSSTMNRMEDIAAKHIQAIQTIQPQGPYLIGGVSFGGHVAFEIARQLLLENQEVSLLAILDVGAPVQNKTIIEEIKTEDLLRGFIQAATVFSKSGKNLQIASFEDLASLSSEEQIEYFKQKLVELGVLSSKVDISQVRSLMAVGKANNEAFDNYQPPQDLYPIPIKLFRAEEEFNTLSNKVKESLYSNPSLKELTWGWDKYSSESVEVHIIPGDHLTMLVEPHVQILAQKLQKCFDQTLT